MKKIYCIIFVLTLLLLFATSLFIFSKGKNHKGILDKLSSAKARFNYYTNKTHNKKLLTIYYVDSFNFQKVLQLSLLLKDSYEFNISNVDLNVNDMVTLSHNENMEILNLVNCTYFPDGNILKKLSANKKLKELGFGCSKPNMQLPIASIDSIPQISSLRIVAANRLSQNFKSEDFESITKLHLDTLDMNASNISNENIAVIVRCTTIKNLSFRQCKFDDVIAIRMIAKMENIITLDLSECHISESVLNSFIHHPSLKTIILNGSRLCKDDVNVIKSKMTEVPRVLGTYIYDN
jgi:hypothetical protein